MSSRGWAWLSREGKVAVACGAAWWCYAWYTRCCAVPSLIGSTLVVDLPSLRRRFLVHPLAVFGGTLETLLLGARMSSLYVPSGGGYAQVVELDDGGRCAINWWRERSSSGAVALVFPGMANSSETGFVRRLCKSLADAGFDAGVVDFRGCGVLCGEDDDFETAIHSLKSWRDVEAVLEACGTDRDVVAVGHSMGGAVLLCHLGRRRCERLKAAVVVSAPLDVVAQDATYPFFARLAVATGCKLLLLLNRAFRASVRRGHTSFASVITATEPHRIITAIKSFSFESPRDYYAQNSPVTALHRVAVPTLLLHSANDPIVPAEIAASADLVAANPNLAAVLTPCGGHLAFLDVFGRPFADDLAIDFLKAHADLSPRHERLDAPPRLQRQSSFRGKVLGF